MKNLFYNRKLVVSIFVVLILVLTAVAIGPIVYSLFKSGGVKTEPVTADGADVARLEPGLAQQRGHGAGPAWTRTSTSPSATTWPARIFAVLRDSSAPSTRTAPSVTS